MKKKYDNLFAEDGTRKIYVPAREYLTWQHPHSMGKPLYYNSAMNMIVMGPRGWGKSYMAGNLAAHEFLFDGIWDLDEYIQGVLDGADHPKTNTIVGAGDAKYSSGTLSKTKLTLDNLPGEVEIDHKLFPSPISKQTIGSFQPGKKMTAMYKKKVGGSWKDMGSMSTVKNRTFKDNPFAAQGERSSVMIWDEIGMFNNLRASLAAVVDVQRIGRWKFGSSFFTGTGGDFEGEGTTDASYMFYHPWEFECLLFKDMWEGYAKPIGLFIPAEMANEDFKDDNGFASPQLLEKGRQYYIKERERLAGGGTDSLTLDNFIVYHPLIPSEIFLSKKGNIFPVAEIQNRINAIRSGDIMSYMQKKVTLYFDSKAKYGVDYKIDIEGKLSPINEFPYNKSNKEGAVVIYEFPLTDDEGNIPKDLYLIGHDPYASDNPEGESLASIYVVKSKKHSIGFGHDEIVAEYVGRPFQGKRVVNEILMKLSMFYGNAKVFFENARGNVKEYFEKHKKLTLLAKQPQTVFSKKAGYESKGAAIYGYPMSSRAMKADAMAYLRDWLLEERGEDEDGKMVRNLDRIWSLALLQELLRFNYDGNFDRVMGLAGAIVGIEETYNQYKKDLIQIEEINDLSFLTGNKKVFTRSPEVSFTL